MSKFCGNCGNMAADEARVCGMCGTPFAAESAPAPVQNQQKKFNSAALKNKKTLIIGAVAIIAVIVAIILAVGGGSKKDDKEGGSASSVANKAISYYVKADPDSLADLTSSDYRKAEYGTDQYAKGDLREDLWYYVDEVEEALEYGCTVDYELVEDYDSDEVDEIKEEFDVDVSAVRIFEYKVTYTHSQYGSDYDYVDVIVWKNDGVWEFVTFD